MFSAPFQLSTSLLNADYVLMSALQSLNYMRGAAFSRTWRTEGYEVRAFAETARCCLSVSADDCGCCRAVASLRDIDRTRRRVHITRSRFLLCPCVSRSRVCGLVWSSAVSSHPKKKMPQRRFCCCAYLSFVLPASSAAAAAARSWPPDTATGAALTCCGWASTPAATLRGINVASALTVSYSSSEQQHPSCQQG